MNSVWRSLFWKEWREHRGKMAALICIALVVPFLFGLADRGSLFSIVTFTVTCVASLGGMFIGMRAAADEQSRGTIRFLQALPAPMAKPAIAKLLLGALTIVAPVTAAVLFAAIWSPPNHATITNVEMNFYAAWGVRNLYAATIVPGAVLGVSLMLWMAAAGVNRSDEVRAGAVGLLVVLACWAALSWTASAVTEPLHAWPYWLRVVSMAAPGASAVLPLTPNRDIVGQSWFKTYAPFLATAALAHIAVAGWYLARFGRMARPHADPAPMTTTAPAWLAPPRRSTASAIAWKQAREIVPLAAIGGALVAVGPIWARLQSPTDEFGLLQIAVGMYGAMGAFVAIVAGIGVFMGDLRPGLHTFWRSRPVNIKQWFAIKFSLSLLATVCLLAIPPVAVGALLWSRLDEIGSEGDNFPGAIASCFLLQVSLFAGAAAAMVLVRQAIYAAILTLGCAAAYTVGFILIYEQLVSPWDASIFGLAKIVAFAISTAAATTVAWLAVKNDWGWKG